MNERFAAEPTTCDSALELKHLLEKFGPATGRYLATYPAHGWARSLLDHIAKWKDVEQAAAKTLLRRANEERTFIRGGGLTYEDHQSWVQNVQKVQKAQDTRSRFDGVVVSRSNAGMFRSLDDFNLPPTAAEPVRARKDEYVRVSKTLLCASPELHFIDPYLDPCKTDRAVVLEGMLGVASSGKCQSANVWVRHKELADSIGVTATKLSNIARAARFSEPRSLFLHAFTDARGDTRVHDRYLLSVYGAIRFEHGFQELTGKRTASVAPESPPNHSNLVRVFLEGVNDFELRTVPIVLS